MLQVKEEAKVSGEAAIVDSEAGNAKDSDQGAGAQTTIHGQPSSRSAVTLEMTCSTFSADTAALCQVCRHSTLSPTPTPPFT